MGAMMMVLFVLGIFLLANAVQTSIIHYEGGFFVLSNVTTKDTHHMTNVGNFTAPEITRQRCQEMCSVRTNCDMFLWFNANNTCQHRLAWTKQGTLVSALKVNSQKKNEFVRYNSAAMYHIVQHTRSIIVPSVVSATECENICDALPNCDVYYFSVWGDSNRDCGIIWDLRYEGEPSTQIGFKKNF